MKVQLKCVYYTDTERSFTKALAFSRFFFSHFCILNLYVTNDGIGMGRMMRQKSETGGRWVINNGQQ